MKNNINYTEVLNTIKYSLYVIIALLLVNVVIGIINVNDIRSLNDNSSNSAENNNDENELPEYDVSEFKEVNYSELKKEIKSEDYTVVYYGREGCGYCSMFIPVMNDVQEDYGFKHLYFDVTQVYNFNNNTFVDEDTYKEITEINDFFEENFLSTPMIAVFKDGKFVDGTVGYQEYSTYASFIEKVGFEKK